MKMWEEVVKYLASYYVPSYSLVKGAILAQWMLETGRGTSNAFKNFLNVAGMKYRDEMAGIASKVWYKTITEGYRNGPNGWEQGDWFCQFETPEDAVIGYFKFLSRHPYSGVTDRTQAPEEFLSFIGPTWCPGGYKKEWMDAHGGKNYHEHILDTLYPEAMSILKEFGYSVPDSVGESVSWFELNRSDLNGQSVMSGMTFTGRCVTNVFGTPSISFETIDKLRKMFPVANTIMVADTENKPIPEAPIWPEVDATIGMPISTPSSDKLKGTKFLLGPGHSLSSPGAKGLGANPPKEWNMNVIQAEEIAKILRAHGAMVTIFDFDPDNLTKDGLQADGYDCYISLHHNAANADGNDEGAEVFIHPAADNKVYGLAKEVCDSICAKIDSRNRGVKRAAWTVLSVATWQTSCKYNMLTESYFIDDYRDIAVAKRRSREAAVGIAEALISFFSDDNNREAPTPIGRSPIAEWSGVRKFSRGEDIQLSKNFHLSEFECKCGCGSTLVNGDHVRKLQSYRDTVGKPIRINSGYRCETHNTNVGGARNSRHCYGDATDITVDGVNPAVVWEDADRLFDGVGKYRTFTHVDSRGYRARWSG